jgi:hypothetical protein
MTKTPKNQKKISDKKSKKSVPKPEEDLDLLMGKLEERLIPLPPPPEFEIEKAKSAIQKCLKCKKVIEKNALRLITRHQGHHKHVNYTYTHFYCVDVKILHEIEEAAKTVENVVGSKLLGEEELNHVHHLKAC